VTTAADVALYVAYRRRVDRIRRVAMARAAAVWVDLGGLDDALVEPFVVEVAAATLPAREAAVDTVAGYIGLVVNDTPPVPRVDLRSVDAEFWRQPFISTWKALKDGRSETEAFAAGARRSRTVALDAVTRTERAALAEIDSHEPRIVGWRRVPNPPVCRWCATVATQRYRTAEAASFGHSRCSCGVVPITGTADPGRVINKPMLDNLKRERDAAYVDEHGHEAPRLDSRDGSTGDT
jgi:hypothetical protein